MDANGLRSFGLSLGTGLQGWPVAAGEGDPVDTIEAGPEGRVPSARLASMRRSRTLRESATRAAEIPLSPAMAVDAAGNYAWWDAASATLWSVSHLMGRKGVAPRAIDLPAAAKPVRDLAFGADDVLYIAGGEGLWLVDMRARFGPAMVAAPPSPPGFTPHRLAAAPEGGVYAADVILGRVARVSGLPLFDTGVDIRRESDARFSAVDLNPDPPRYRILAAAFDAGERPVGLATGDDGRLWALCVRQAGGAALRLLDENGCWSPPLRLTGLRFPHSLGWLDDTRLAVMGDAVELDDEDRPLAGRDLGAFVYAVPAAVRDRMLAGEAAAGGLFPDGDYYPLVGREPGPFASLHLRARGGGRSQLLYPRRSRHRTASGPLPEPSPVARLSQASRAGRGVVANYAPGGIPNARIRAAAGVIDTGDTTTAWHRLYLEAAVPANTAMILWLAATESGPPAFDAENDALRAGWHPHLAGDRRALPAEVADRLPKDTPRAAWLREASEVAGGTRLLGCDPEPGAAGLFTVLIQRAGLAVRTLAGRRLWVVAELFGDGRATPELAALRAYAGRVSYRDRYLPALYREQVFGEEADLPGAATPADFLGRLVDLFEGVFTPVEDRVAGAHLHTDPFACAPETLPWLGGWIGLALEPGVPAQRARWMIANAPRLARRHGTLEGLKLALDIATDGGVTRGRLVIVENFRLRRTLATILGAHLVDAQDPLTAGLAVTGNSFVGDSLFLGDAEEKAFLALFRRLRVDPALGDAEADRLDAERSEGIHALYDHLAHRVTVLVHETADGDEFRSVARLATDGAPAHVAVDVVRASHPLMVAVASLVGADTFLREPEPADAVRLDVSRLGYTDTLQGLGTLDARLGAFGDWAAGEKPLADAGPDREVSAGLRFTLDGSASRAAPGREIDTYRWRLLPPAEPDR